MNRISEITKRDIFDLFQNGMDIYELFETKRVTYPYFGQVEEIDFLKRLYNLESMPSEDDRFSNAEADIWQHTVNNDDYPYCWVFEDKRFNLKDGNDEMYLKFISEIFHPAVRYEKGYWKEFLAEINKLLQHDGYEIYPSKKISNRNVYNWDLYQPENKVFIPFSLRNKNAIKQKLIVFKIKREARNQIYKIFKSYDYIDGRTDDTGWNYEVLISEDIFSDIEKFYPPKCFNDKKQYVETNNLKDFILFTSPYSVIDAIEFFDKYCNSNFAAEVNTIFDLNDISLKLNNGKVQSLVDDQITNSSLTLIEETGLKELLQEASRYYEKKDLKTAVEKIWDAFERLKTYYSPTLDKKTSVNRIILDMSNNNKSFEVIFEKEFNELTMIGNKFRIRHHEKTIIDIEDDKHYDYFYKRCLTLITTAIRYLNNEEAI